ncbi:apolipoprotein L3-like [Sinocyclocheilus grahami]|uniref:apolipoprotein L3-like n=1 Tax=Sinocyclocheilus grahami TaxID=75366 RepID=UPI0007AC7AA7|nr:PREDICTED: apolipoprotein L3-like [Sinocyclocheilus grahami]
MADMETIGISSDPYTSSVRGAELYHSPEVEQNKYTSKSDICSLGWVLYDLCMLDVWSDIKKRRFQKASHDMEYPLHFSDMYSQDLQNLIKEMLSCCPMTRPSADEILAKPFLRVAVNRNRRFPEALEQRFRMSLRIFDENYNEHYDHFEALVTEWGETTASLEEVHHNCTAGTLAGSVIGAAGGITAVVGAILAPFTFGASLIVTGVGIGVGVAGGVTGAASSVTNAVKQKSLRENIQRIQQNFTDVTPLFESLNALIKELKDITADLESVHKVTRWAVSATVAGTACTITNMIKQKNLRQTIKKITDDFQNIINAIITHLKMYSTEISEMNQPADKRKAEHIKSETLKCSHHIKKETLNDIESARDTINGEQCEQCGSVHIMGVK